MKKTHLFLVGAEKKSIRKRPKPKPSLLEILRRQREKVGCRPFKRDVAPELYDLGIDATYQPAKRRTMYWRGLWLRVEHGLTTRRVRCPVTGAVLVAALDI